MIREDLISVIIPVYKVEDYLEKCIRSVVRNTYRNLEIICIDDGSPDSSGLILDRLAKEDERIIVIHQENGGVSAARNAGLKSARGELIAFIDSDDYIHPDYFQSLIDCMHKTDACMAVCNAEKVYEEDKTEYPEHKEIRYQKRTAEQFFGSYYARHMVWARLYRKKDLQGLWFDPEVKRADDTLYNLRVIHNMEDPVVYETDIPLYYYLIRSSSIVHTATLEQASQFGNWYCTHRKELNTARSGWQWMLVLQTIKSLLSYRYGMIVSGMDKSEIGRTNRMLKECYKDLRKDPAAPVKQKILHAVMIKSPALYRYYRIKDDPTLKTWEKQLCNGSKT